jgi:hypothetical protein
VCVGVREGIEREKLGKAANIKSKSLNKSFRRRCREKYLRKVSYVFQKPKGK